MVATDGRRLEDVVRTELSVFRRTDRAEQREIAERRNVVGFPEKNYLLKTKY